MASFFWNHQVIQSSFNMDTIDPKRISSYHCTSPEVAELILNNLLSSNEKVEDETSYSSDIWSLGCLL